MLANRGGWHSKSWVPVWFLRDTPHERYSNCSMPQFPSHEISTGLFSFCQGCYESEIYCFNVKDWGAAVTRIPSIRRFFLHLSEPQMYSFELFNTCDKYSASVLIWLHLRISKHWENFNDLGDTVPALIKINSNTSFDAVVTQPCHRLYNTLRRKVYISCFFQSKNNMAFLRSDRSELQVPAVRWGSSWPKKAKFS